MPAPTPRVLLADDDPIVRRALRAVLTSADITVQAEAVSVQEALLLAEEVRPAAVLADVRLPEEGGLALAARLRETVPEAHVILLASVEDPEEGIEGLRAGARGYLSKGVAMKALPRAVDAMIRGEIAVSRNLVGAMAEELRRGFARPQGMRPVRSALTDREWEVLDLLCDGLGTDAIAKELFLSRETIRSHVKHITRKLGVSSRAEAVAEAAALRGRDGRRAVVRTSEAARSGVGSHP